ncbi:MAG: SpoIIE family protein phosphatase [Chloroflexota bacterium]|nr:SpoIIE family protein phosphatase [Chloroflexota bacterium]
MQIDHGRILIVDDNEMTRETLARKLEQQGYVVTCVAERQQALELIAARPFDLVLVEIGQAKIVPGPAPLGVPAAQLSGRLPVSLLERASDLVGIERFVAIGIAEYVSEPFWSLLQARVAAYCDQRRILDQQHDHDELLKYERDLQIGREIQTSFLPDPLPQMDGWQIAACFHPAREVAGDFYDAFTLEHNRVGLVIGDVCDKGVGAALFMALVRSLIRAFAQQHYAVRLLDALSHDPSVTAPVRQAGQALMLPSAGFTALKQAVVLTNNYVARTHGASNMFATLFFGVLDPASGQLIYVNGGHEPPTILGPHGVKARLMPTGPAVGMMANMEYEIQQVQLDHGDVLLAYTDGVTEARDPQGKFFTERGLIELLAAAPTSAATLLEQIEARVRAHMDGAVQFDDLTMLAVQRVPATSPEHVPT